MRRSLFTILVASTLLSCHFSGKTDDTHLPPNKMEKVMLDIHLAESYSLLIKDSLHKVGEKNADSLAVYYKAIFSRHGITPEQFNQSMSWYKNHPEDFDSVYNRMIATAVKWQANMLPSPAAAVPPPLSPANKP
jgi:hypothetical protein